MTAFLVFVLFRNNSDFCLLNILFAMLRARRLGIVLCIFFCSALCNLEIGRNSMRSQSRQERKSPIETINIEDEGAKNRRNTFILNMTMPGAHSIKVGNEFYFIFGVVLEKKILPAGIIPLELV